MITSEEVLSRLMRPADGRKSIPRQDFGIVVDVKLRDIEASTASCSPRNSTGSKSDFFPFENHVLFPEVSDDVRIISASNMDDGYRVRETRSTISNEHQDEYGWNRNDEFSLYTALDESPVGDRSNHVPDYSASPFRVASVLASSANPNHRTSDSETSVSEKNTTKFSQWTGSRDRFSKSISYSLIGIGDRESDGYDYDPNIIPVTNFDPFATIVDDDEFPLPDVDADDRLSALPTFDPLQTINDEDDVDETAFIYSTTNPEIADRFEYNKNEEEIYPVDSDNESSNPFRDVHSNVLRVNSTQGTVAGTFVEDIIHYSSAKINPFNDNDRDEDNVTHFDGESRKFSDEFLTTLPQNEYTSVGCKKQTPVSFSYERALTADIGNRTDNGQIFFEGQNQPTQTQQHHHHFSNSTWESDDFVRRTIDSSFDELAVKSRNIIDRCSQNGIVNKRSIVDDESASKTLPIFDDNVSTSSADSSTSSEYDSSYCDDPLEPFHTDRRPDRWSLLLRLPVKKKLIATSSRVWKPVHVRLVCEPVFDRVGERSSERHLLRVFGDKTEKELILELPLQPFYRIVDEGLQSVDEHSKCNVVTLQRIYYAETISVKSNRPCTSLPRLRDITAISNLRQFKKSIVDKVPRVSVALEHTPQSTELLKFGGLNHAVVTQLQMQEKCIPLPRSRGRETAVNETVV